MAKFDLEKTKSIISDTLVKGNNLPLVETIAKAICDNIDSIYTLDDTDHIESLNFGELYERIVLSLKFKSYSTKKYEFIVLEKSGFIGVNIECYNNDNYTAIYSNIDSSYLTKTSKELDKLVEEKEKKEKEEYEREKKRKESRRQIELNKKQYEEYLKLKEIFESGES